MISSSLEYILTLAIAVLASVMAVQVGYKATMMCMFPLLCIESSLRVRDETDNHPSKNNSEES